MAAGKDLRSVASEVGIAEQTLKIMGGERSKSPSPERLLEIAEATGAPIEWIVGGWDAVVAKSTISAEAGGELVTAELLALARDLSRRQEEAEIRDERRERALVQLDERLRALERGGGLRPRGGRSQ